MQFYFCAYGKRIFAVSCGVIDRRKQGLPGKFAWQIYSENSGKNGKIVEAPQPCIAVIADP
jgi:hypothetical protein